MKLVMIIVRESMYYETNDALLAAGFNAMSGMEIVGRGKKRVDYVVGDSGRVQDAGLNELVAKTLLEVYVSDEFVEPLIETVLTVNRKNNSGDGKIFIIPVEDGLRIRTNETGEKAAL
jgi:nitrogen regulatory protein PII